MDIKNSGKQRGPRCSFDMSSSKTQGFPRGRADPSLLIRWKNSENSEEGTLALFHAEAMLRTGEAAGPDVGGIFGGGGRDQRREFGIAAHKPWLELREEAEHVVGDEDLAVAGGRGADADRRYRHGFGDCARDRL